MWPWKARIEPDDQPIVCPVCHGDKPKARIQPLYSYVRRGSQIVEVLDGYRLSCQECPATFSLWYSNRSTFLQHSQSLPYVGQVKAMEQVKREVQERPPALVPRVRPSI